MTGENIAPQNRLVGESSPYLLQHASNPVAWQPWDEAALQEAQITNKPVFLSIGYAACHWCHVMERESFQDEETARLLNAHFVPIKVDREERPDLDEVYMQAVQMITGSGGWPLNVFLTPDGRPFFGGTYFPPEPRYGMTDFRSVLKRISEFWQTRHEDLLHDAAQLTEAIQSNATFRHEGDHSVPKNILEKTALILAREYDRLHGGFGGAPKFPPASAVRLLLRRHLESGNAHALEMATHTLDQMAWGGLFDQVGGGFHRYSTDEKWLVPHFEKMLYDNALLVMAYTEAWQVTGKRLYARVVRETLEYILRDMTSPEGGFYSSEDADSEGVEGLFYTWTAEELREVLGAQMGDFVGVQYCVPDGPNFEGRNILEIPKPVRDADQLEKLQEETLAEPRMRLLEARNGRKRPDRDDKVLAGWNGLMISALARAGAALQHGPWVAAAQKAAGFVVDTLWENPVLHHSWRGGKISHAGYLEDYAAMAVAFLDLYETTWDAAWLDLAEAVAAGMVEQFADPEKGGFFSTTKEQAAELPARMKLLFDGATPSGNSLALEALSRLERLRESPFFMENAEVLYRYLAPAISGAPRVHLDMTRICWDYSIALPTEVALVGDLQSPEALAMRQALGARFIKGLATAGFDPQSMSARLMQEIPMLEGKDPKNHSVAAWVCHNHVCAEPVFQADDLVKMLEEKAHS